VHKLDGVVHTLADQEQVPNLFLFLPPGYCNLGSVGLGSIALLYLSGSVWSMMRGSMIIFSGILSVFFLKRKLMNIHWFGIFVVTIGLIIIGLSSILNSGFGNNNSSMTEQLFAFLCVVIGMFLQAIQLILEESFLKHRKLNEAMIIGFEGMWGSVTLIAVMLPIMYAVPGKDHGSYENTGDGLYNLTHSAALFWFFFIQFLSIPSYNILALKVTKKLTAIHRTLLDAMRTSFVWLINLFIFYAVSNKYGESWNHYSWLQVIGFFVLILGTAIYNKLFYVPGFYYEEKDPNFVPTK